MYQFVLVEASKPGSKGMMETRLALMPIGYSFLPYSGGWLDQPAYICDTFDQFMQGERIAAFNKLTKGR